MGEGIDIPRTTSDGTVHPVDAIRHHLEPHVRSATLVMVGWVTQLREDQGRGKASSQDETLLAILQRGLADLPDEDKLSTMLADLHDTMYPRYTPKDNVEYLASAAVQTIFNLADWGQVGRMVSEETERREALRQAAGKMGKGP